MSVAEENPEVRPAQPLYDLLASPPAGADDFALRLPAPGFSVLKGRSATTTVVVVPRGNFRSSVSLTVSGLPPGVTASFSPVTAGGTNKMTLTANDSANLGTSTITITGTSGGISHTVTSAVSVNAVKQGTVAVDLSSAYNVTGIHTDGSASLPRPVRTVKVSRIRKKRWGRRRFGMAFCSILARPTRRMRSRARPSRFQPASSPASELLATGVEGGQESQVFTITYADGTSSSVTQSLSDWYEPSGYKGESEAVVAPYRLVEDGSKDNRTFYLYGYSFNLDSNKVVRSITLPGNEHVLVFAMTLVP